MKQMINFLLLFIILINIFGIQYMYTEVFITEWVRARRSLCWVMAGNGKDIVTPHTSLEFQVQG